MNSSYLFFPKELVEHQNDSLLCFIYLQHGLALKNRSGFTQCNYVMHAIRIWQNKFHLFTSHSICSATINSHCLNCSTVICNFITVCRLTECHLCVTKNSVTQRWVDLIVCSFMCMPAKQKGKKLNCEGILCPSWILYLVDIISSNTIKC